VLSVKSHSTRQEKAVQALERLRGMQTKVLGVVLNKVQDKWLAHLSSGFKR
jgi:Mrp family chromosome partitioning ATPase